mmetsp:Transcript_116872/g.372088  ORF Transcript_116872/g.372088 Transcript_116872/m.372088 type:complete len:333 (-) Transcript_116872:1510-2508(-)
MYIAERAAHLLGGPGLAQGPSQLHHLGVTAVNLCGQLEALPSVEGQYVRRVHFRRLAQRQRPGQGRHGAGAIAAIGTSVGAAGEGALGLRELILLATCPAAEPTELRHLRRIEGRPSAARARLRGGGGHRRAVQWDGRGHEAGVVGGRAPSASSHPRCRRRACLCNQSAALRHLVVAQDRGVSCQIQVLHAFPPRLQLPSQVPVTGPIALVCFRVLEFRLLLSLLLPELKQGFYSGGQNLPLRPLGGEVLPQFREFEVEAGGQIGAAIERRSTRQLGNSMAIVPGWCDVSESTEGTRCNLLPHHRRGACRRCRRGGGLHGGCGNKSLASDIP